MTNGEMVLDFAEGWAGVVREHLLRRPGMELRDVYKLLCQGVRGPEHLVTTPDDFAARLHAEWETVAAEDSEPLLESIRPDQRLSRVNLRPYKARGGEVEALVEACLEAAGSTWGTPDDLRQAWATFVVMCRTDPATAFRLDEVLAFSGRLEAQGYPVLHHSQRYRDLYRPAYRLVSLR